ncbi:MAG: SDR family oxidoreductase [Saprospiraceae bacterium]|nr:SDR family oxidoreductase [Saprospiraceae bacterium]
MLSKNMLSPDTYEGQVVLITGGGTGLGKSMTEHYLSLGAKVIITSRKQDVLDETAKALDPSGENIFAISGDVRKADDVDRVVAASVAHFGKIDVLINNAAGNFVMPTERLSSRAFESIIGIVLQGSINYCLAVGKYWIKEGIKGNILNIITTYAFTGTAFTVPSACAKAGVLALTRSLAVEWGKKYGIRINAVAPGPFPTEGAWQRLIPPAFADLADPAKQIPLGRVGEHIELTNLCTYLTSPYAAYINGADIVIDGGEWLMGAGQFNQYLAIPEQMWDMLEQMRGK